ncbi:cellulose binding domain-containing protein [Glaciecola sp. MH2013]|nr:cellulose binding domain-containing protein [Glaciecola sp. MH2013]
MTLYSAQAFSHGLIVQPASRNATCGLPEDQKPHNATIQACIDAFQADQNGGYQFMSVLTHDVGRQGVTPLPENVCGFNSETWDNYNNGNTTPWDLPLDWPTTPVAAGNLDFVWNISWGPHFDDTDEFVYYITKPDFVYQVGVPLTWDDFESEPFCKEDYDDTNPNGNPNITPDKGATTFTTSCQLPERSGRHVVYGEWGRNQFTFERFHGCVDVSFSGSGGGGTVNQAPSAIAQSVDVDEGSSVAITLAGTDSDGTIDSYVISTQAQSGVLSGSGANLTYSPNAGFSGADSFAFVVRDNDGALSSPATVSITVNDTGGGGTVNQMPIAAFTFAANDLAVSFAGGMSSDPDNAPVSPLSYSWDFGDGSTSTEVGPVHTYAVEGSYSVSLTVSDGDLSDTLTQTVMVTEPVVGVGSGATCTYAIANSWNSGFVAEITIANTGTSTINGWDVSWAYTDGSSVTNGWNSVLSGTGAGPYTASNLAWNATIEPGSSVVFGFQGSHNGSAPVVNVTGDICE